MDLSLADGLLALAAHATDEPILYLAATEQRAERLAILARAAFPQATSKRRS